MARTIAWTGTKTLQSAIVLQWQHRVNGGKGKWVVKHRVRVKKGGTMSEALDEARDWCEGLKRMWAKHGHKEPIYQVQQEVQEITRKEPWQ